MWARHNINVNCILPGLIATEELKGYGIIPPSVDDQGNPVPRLDLPPNPEDVEGGFRLRTERFWL